MSESRMLEAIKRRSKASRERYIEALIEREATAERSAHRHDTAFFSVDELRQFGFTTVGTNVKVSRKCSLYAIKGTLGDHIRIDDYCTLKGEVVIGSYVHIAAYVMISGAFGRITFKPFSSSAARSTFFSGSDDHRVSGLNNPMPPQEFVSTIKGPVTIGTGTLVGAHCVVLPNVTIGDGASIGSGCVVYRQVPDGGVLRMPAAILQLQRRDYKAITALAAQVLAAGD